METKHVCSETTFANCILESPYSEGGRSPLPCAPHSQITQVRAGPRRLSLGVELRFGRRGGPGLTPRCSADLSLQAPEDGACLACRDVIPEDARGWTPLGIWQRRVCEYRLNTFFV